MIAYNLTQQALCIKEQHKTRYFGNLVMSGGGVSGLAPIQKVFQMAKKTFARSRGPDGKRRHRLDSQDLRSHLKQLSELMNVLTAKDLALDQSQVCEILHSPYIIIGYQD